jgi:hypothetical protein
MWESEGYCVIREEQWDVILGTYMIVLWVLFHFLWAFGQIWSSTPDFGPEFKTRMCRERDEDQFQPKIEEAKTMGPKINLMGAFPGMMSLTNKIAIEDNKKDNAFEMSLILGNLIHQKSDLPPEEKTETDLGVKLHLRPVEIIYQAHAVENLTRFFKVKNLSAETKIAAKAQFD